jgi:hypothetical protein
VRPVPAVVVAAEVTWPPKTPKPPSLSEDSLKVLVIVEEAVERKPFVKARVVEVAFSLVESLV